MGSSLFTRKPRNFRKKPHRVGRIFHKIDWNIGSTSYALTLSHPQYRTRHGAKWSRTSLLSYCHKFWKCALIHCTTLKKYFYKSSYPYNTLTFIKMKLSYTYTRLMQACTRYFLGLSFQKPSKDLNLEVLLICKKLIKWPSIGGIR